MRQLHSSNVLLFKSSSSRDLSKSQSKTPISSFETKWLNLKNLKILSDKRCFFSHPYDEFEMNTSINLSVSRAIVVTVINARAITVWRGSVKTLVVYNSEINNSSYLSTSLQTLALASPVINSSCTNTSFSISAKACDLSTIIPTDFPILELFTLKFEFDGLRLRLCPKDNNHSTDELLSIGFRMQEFFQLINQKGYVPNNFTLKPLFNRIQDHMNSVGFRVKYDFGTTENTFSLWFNFIRLNLFHLTSDVIAHSKANTFEDEALEKLSELENLRDSLFSSLDPFLRVQIQKRGITIYTNTYTSFDTEYTLRDSTRFLNKLVSTQLAVQSRVIIKLPMYRRYDISYIHPLTSEVTTFHKPKNLSWEEKSGGDEVRTIIEMGLLNESLKYSIDSIRKSKFETHDKIISELTSYLEDVQGIKFFEDNKKDQVVFALPLSKVHTAITYPEKTYSLKDLVSKAKALGISDLCDGFDRLLEEFRKLPIVNEGIKLNNWFNHSKKARSRTTLSFLTGDKISLSLIKNNYIISHYNSSDLSILDDFIEFKDELNIVNKSFVTLNKPFEFEGSNIYIRDTHLLTPAAGGKGLAALGKLYSEELEDYKKIEVTKDDIEHMDEFLLRDPKAFEAYAIRDTLIPLKHAVTLESVNFDIKRIGIPITLSSMGRALVLDKWSTSYEQFFPYQLSGEFLMGNANEIQTPKGLSTTGEVGLFLGHYISNYKGGRNESFMYGCEESTIWYDYDLASAYSTAMTHLTLPDYSQGRVLDAAKVEKMTTEQLLSGYLVIDCLFKFPDDTKYPSLPCYLDKTATVYPLQGSCVLTGPEFVLAKQQNCKIDIKSAFYIHGTYKEKVFGKQTIQIPVTPFKDVIQDLHAKRRGYPKGHVLNSLYKELTNSIYGNVVRGMGNKLNFDTKTGTTVRTYATEMSNPVLASWTTAFIRSVIGECLHNIGKIGGKIVSVTTDGFITNVEDLESKLLKLPIEYTPLLTLFKSLRIALSDDVKNHVALELKNQSKGIISWSTRGQLGIEKGIKATTGFQSGGYTQEEMVSTFKDVLKQRDKSFEYTQFRLRGAKDIFKKGGHVTPTYRDQKVRLLFDNRRVIIDTSSIHNFDMSSTLVDSKPYKTKDECRRQRFISKFPNINPYLKTTPTRKNSKSIYRDYLEIGYRNFIKGYLADEPLFGFKGDEFKRYKHLISFIQGFNLSKELKISFQSISQLKLRKAILRPVPNTRENIAFAAYIKSKIPYFDVMKFLK